MMELNTNIDEILQRISLQILSGNTDMADALFYNCLNEMDEVSDVFRLKAALWFGNSSKYENIELAFKCINGILLNHPENEKVVISKAYIEYLHYGQISDQSKNALSDGLYKQSNYVGGYYYLLSQYYLSKGNFEEYITFLKQSAVHDNGAVLNHKFLARHYSSNSEFKLALQQIEISIANINRVIKEGEILDWSDFDLCFNSNIRGTIISEMNFKDLVNEGNEIEYLSNSI